MNWNLFRALRLIRIIRLIFLLSVFLTLYTIYFIPNTTSAAAPTNGLVGHWAFDEGSGTVANDSSGNGNNGTISGATWATGKIGNGALGFDGNDYLALGNPTSLYTSVGTICSWVKTNSDAPQTIFGLNASGGTAFSVVIGNGVTGSLTNELVTVVIGNIINRIGYTTTSRELIDNDWHNVCVSSNGSNYSIYTDGISKTVVVGSGVNNGKWTDTQIYTNALIGASAYWNQYFNGDIDDIRIYDRALSSSEILDIYNDTGGTPPPPTPINGLCGATVNTCTTGTFSDISDTATEYLWACLGSNGGTNSSCSLPIPPSFGQQTYYVDFQNGSDSNPGVSKSAPWKHAPGMNGCSDNCAAYQSSHSSSANTTGAGNSFIFKGGVTWPNEVFTWDWNLGGGTGWNKEVDAIYFGVDPTWYSGPSWSRPVFDAGGSAISPNSRTSTANTMFRVYKGSGGYFIIDNLEFKGLSHLDNTERSMVSLSALYSELKNSYFHGWSHGGTATSDNFRVITSSYDTPNLTVSIHHNVIDGSDSSPTPGDMAAALKGHVGQLYNNYIGYVQNGEMNNRIGYVWGNTFDHIATITIPDFDPTQHHQNYQSYGDGDSYIYNNLSINPNGGSTFILYPTDSYKFYIFNNVVIGDTNQTLQLSSNDLISNNTAGFFVWNNTFQAPAGSSACLINGPAGATYVSGMTVRNNHVIATNNTVNMGHSTTQINTNHLGQTNAEATSVGYVSDSTYPYQPPNGSAGTVDTGYDMSALCSSLTDYSTSVPSEDCLKDATLGVSYNTIAHTVSYPYRTTATRLSWDRGAYEFISGTGDTVAPLPPGGVVVN